MSSKTLSMDDHRVPLAHSGQSVLLNEDLDEEEADRASDEVEFDEEEVDAEYNNLGDEDALLGDVETGNVSSAPNVFTSANLGEHGSRLDSIEEERQDNDTAPDSIDMSDVLYMNNIKEVPVFEEPGDREPGLNSPYILGEDDDDVLDGDTDSNSTTSGSSGDGMAGYLESMTQSKEDRVIVMDIQGDIHL
eukprot:TRINITY_DN2282_c0_g2_i3.p1 TRINITY_DN2282_c0_g2~~TRINITY_DN2282_c0_g2_i3.p1  ORF type:complete len:191 (-),score=72.17 TRINITY_DN2282_c0_g2_i3:93-665(-)